MSIGIPRQLPLRDPREFRFANEIKGLPWGKDMLEYLVQANRSLQVMNEQMRNVLVSARASGTAVIDNGTTRMTVLVSHGAIESVTTAASAGATLSWTPA